MEIILADREAEIMEVLWDAGPSTVAEVKDRVPDELAYTTVLTILRNLESKGYVTHDADGKAHRYSPLIERDAARRSALQAMAAKFFKGSTAMLLTHLVEDEKLSSNDVKRLRDMLSKRGRKSRS
ncbi:MAG: Penicillinase repressor [Steroidobacteraceae bacterium]|nr:Penicillinase repressor [Steroidobacteraceae bacterium]